MSTASKIGTAIYLLVCAVIIFLILSYLGEMLLMGVL